MSKKYNCDSEGFVRVTFVSQKSTHRSKGASKDSSEGTELAEIRPVIKGFGGVTIPEEFMKLADKGELTMDYLLKMEYTTLLRAATYPPAQEFIMKNIGIRGVPLLDKIKRTKKDISIFPHQIETLRWMKDREDTPTAKTQGIRGGIVSLKMGLGKTLLALLHILSRPRGEFPSLVVASKTIMHEWEMEGIEKFFGKNIKVLYLHKDFMQKKDLEAVSRKDLRRYDLVVTTYDVCIQACRTTPYYEECYEMGDEHTLMKGKIAAIHCRTAKQADKPKVKGLGILYCTPWERVVCDESQRFANPKTSTYKCVMALYGKYKWCLSGTPIRNYCTDVWAQLRFCGYSGVAQAIEWKRTYTIKMKEHRLTEAIFAMDYKDADIVLPPKTEYFDHVELTGNHKIFYEWMLGRTRDAYDSMMKGGCQFASVLAKFTRLRQASIAPFLITAEAKRNKIKGKEKELLEKELKEIKERFADSEMFKWLNDKNTDSGIESCKIRAIVNTLKKIKETGEKVLIFSMFTSCLDLVVDAIKKHIPDYEYIQVDGDVTGAERSQSIESFRRNDKVKVMLMSYKVGSEGLTLVEANHCICIEPWWTNAVHNQAKARVYRTGQTKEVFVHNILVDGSIEEKVMEICKDKDQLEDSMLNGTSKSLGKNQGLNKFTLGKMLGVR